LITYEAKDKATNNSSKKSSNNSYKNKILFYADDDEIIRKAAEKHIAKINRTRNDTNQIQTFASGEDLLAAVEAGNNVDIVITDHNMGAMSGIELVRKLREINFDKKIFIVANYSKNDFEKIALHAGADGFFQAPLDVAILNEMIQ
jgi:CheY-like chemotaxis protein